MTAGLKHNIEAMKRTKQLPSFVQVLVTLEEALAENERHMREKVALAALVTNERDEVERLKIENNERVTKLLAQIIAMRVEIERLTAERDDWYMKGLKAEADNERLRALLRDAANEIDELGFPSKADEILRDLELKP